MQKTATKLAAAAALAVAGLGFMGATASEAEARTRCYPAIRATGVGNVIPAIARVNAQIAWRREARTVYGYRPSWALARNKRMFCEGVGLTTRCTAQARPCQ